MPATPANNNDAPINQIPARTLLSREAELWFSIPKSGKTLGGSDEAFLGQAGYTITQKIARVDDYILRANDAGDDKTTIRTFIARPDDALADIIDGGLDVALVGRDVLKEVNATLPNDQKIKEILDLNIASCVLTMAVEQDDNRPMDAFNNVAFATKYEGSLKKFLNRPDVNVTPSRIYVRKGGMEGMIKRYKSQGLIAIADIVESGESLIENGLKPYGISDEMWGVVKNGTRFANLPASDLAQIPGVITMSHAVLVRTPNKLSPTKEAALQNLAQRFFATASANGRKPTMKMRIRKPTQERTAPSFIGHSMARGWR